MAWFGLAAHLGMSVARAQREISSREFAEWMAYRRLRHDPEDVRCANLAVWLGKVHGVKDCKLSDFLPRLGAPVVQSSEEIKARLQAFGAGRKRARERKEALRARRERREAHKRKRLNHGDEGSRRNCGRPDCPDGQVG